MSFTTVMVRKSLYSPHVHTKYIAIFKYKYLNHQVKEKYEIVLEYTLTSADQFVQLGFLLSIGLVVPFVV
jgi:hypothetical protein